MLFHTHQFGKNLCLTISLLERLERNRYSHISGLSSKCTRLLFEDFPISQKNFCSLIQKSHF